MGSAIVDRLFGISSGEEAVDEAGSKAVTAADAVEDFQIRPVNGFMEFAVVIADRAPVVEGRSLLLRRRIP